MESKAVICNLVLELLKLCLPHSFVATGMQQATVNVI